MLQGVNQAYYEPLSMIPAPAATEAAAGEFLLRSGTGISIDPAFESSGEVADMLNAFLKKHYGKIRVSEQQNQGDANVIWARHDT